MDAFDLTAADSFTGKWWYSETPEVAAIGTLTYSLSQGVSLKLESHLNFPDNSTLYGYSKGLCISLCACYGKSSSGPGPDLYWPTDVIVNFAYIGPRHIQSGGFFDKATFDLKGLTKYLEYKPYKVKNDNSIEIASKSIKKLYEKENGKISLCLRQYPHVSSDSYDLSIKSCSLVDLYSSEGLTRSNIMLYGDTIRKMFSFFARYELDYKSITLEKDGEKFSHIFGVIPLRHKYPATDICDFHSFIGPDEFLERPKYFIENWLMIREKSAEVLGLYYYTSQGMQHNKCLEVFQALEYYHRKCVDTKEKRFKARLINIMDGFPEIIRLLGNKEVISELIRDHRDYYSHWMEYKKEKILKGRKLEYLYHDALLILEMCILKESGLDNKEIIKIIFNCLGYTNYLQIGYRNGKPLNNRDRVEWKS